MEVATSFVDRIAYETVTMPTQESLKKKTACYTAGKKRVVAWLPRATYNFTTTHTSARVFLRGNT